MKTPETLKQKLESHIAFLSVGRSEEEIRAAFEDIVGAVCDEMASITDRPMEIDEFNCASCYDMAQLVEELKKLTKERLLKELEN